MNHEVPHLALLLLDARARMAEHAAHAVLADALLVLGAWSVAVLLHDVGALEACLPLGVDADLALAALSVLSIEVLHAHVALRVDILREGVALHGL
eukprot:4261183-Alexandrium_andersonii.AAC.1